jgi:hypothetical protein
MILAGREGRVLDPVPLAKNWGDSRWPLAQLVDPIIPVPLERKPAASSATGSGGCADAPGPPLGDCSPRSAG